MLVYVLTSARAPEVITIPEVFPSPDHGQQEGDGGRHNNGASFLRYVQAPECRGNISDAWTPSGIFTSEPPTFYTHTDYFREF